MTIRHCGERLLRLDPLRRVRTNIFDIGRSIPSQVSTSLSQLIETILATGLRRYDINK